mmetsp:Transcript_58693/g.132841  ORF Transcript_58693/g.132841 Transcript_58693/m.132841 type:complete len:246 (-) Transcript_58693:845-1582(-)
MSSRPGGTATARRCLGCFGGGAGFSRIEAVTLATASGEQGSMRGGRRARVWSMPATRPSLTAHRTLAGFPRQPRQAHGRRSALARIRSRAKRRASEAAVALAVGGSAKAAVARERGGPLTSSMTSAAVDLSSARPRATGDGKISGCSGRSAWDPGDEGAPSLDSAPGLPSSGLLLSSGQSAWTPAHKASHAGPPLRMIRHLAEGAPSESASSYARASPWVCIRVVLNFTTQQSSSSRAAALKKTK